VYILLRPKLMEVASTSIAKTFVPPKFQLHLRLVKRCKCLWTIIWGSLVCGPPFCSVVIWIPWPLALAKMCFFLWLLLLWLSRRLKTLRK